MNYYLDTKHYEISIFEGDEWCVLFIDKEEVLRSHQLEMLTHSLENASTGHEGWDKLQAEKKYSIPPLGKWDSV